jgi:hypothetical protein
MGLKHLKKIPWWFTFTRAIMLEAGQKEAALVLAFHALGSDIL